MKNNGDTKGARQEGAAETAHHGPSGKVEPRVNADAKNTRMITVKHWQAVEAAVIVAIAIIIWGLFSLPSLLYLKRNLASKQETAIFSNTCTPVYYANNQSMCYPVLQQYESCNSAMNDTNGVYISSTANVNESENIASQLKILRSLLSPQCLAASLPLICLYLFPLCNGNGTLYLPSSEQCYSVSGGSCKEEWVVAQAVVNGLPNCAVLPNVSSCNKSIVVPSSPQIAERLNCSENFIFNGNYCLPACPNWVLGTGGIFNDDYIVIASAAVGLICGIFFFVVSCLHHKRMFVFPSILVVYQTAICILLSVFVIINRVDTKALYCTSPDWITTLKNPSAFCLVAGSVLFWCMMQIAVLWLCHVSIIFWTVSWPAHYMTFTANHHMKYIHVLIMIVATLAPSVVLIVAFMTGGFRNSRFPPVLCVPKSADAGFYSLVLPISVMIPTGASLLLIAFLTIRKKQGHEKNKESTKPTPLGTAEIKILIIFFYYFLLGSITLAAIELDAKFSNNLMTSVTLYFACESTAPGNCDSFRDGALKYTYHSLSNTAYSLLALFPLVNLVYATSFSNAKKMCFKIFRVKKASAATSTPVLLLKITNTQNDS